MIKINYKTKAERSRIIKEMSAKGATLVEDQSHLDGKHLLFDIPERNLTAEVDNLVTQLKAKGVID